MAVYAQAQENNPQVKAKGLRTQAFSRLAKYTTVRLLTLAVTVIISIFLTILIANMGGYVDKIRLGDIQENVALAIRANPAYRNLTTDERQKLIREQVEVQVKTQGLDKPFVVRTAQYMKDALTLNLGRALKMTSDSGSRQVRLIILERLPSTMVLFGSAGFILFFVEVTIALAVSRRYGSFLDKLFVTLSPASSAPAWFYGIFLIMIFASVLRILPFGGMIEAPVPDNPIDYAISLIQHMILPVLALTLSQSFLAIYTWRTFFLIYATEDYVDMAKAKGLASRDIERRYVLRPTLPTIITTFALTLIGFWVGAPVMETIFQWPGLGQAFYQAVQFYDTPVIVGQTIINAYLLLMTVFILDFIYAIVDPRVKIGGQEGA